jgi:acyl-CoA dehydrogenase
MINNKKEEYMYGFIPSEEQKMLIDAVSRFARSEMRPIARDAEEMRELSAEVIATGWELGILQASVPEAYGGFGERSAVTGVLAAEELGWGDLSGSLALMLPSLFVTPILLCGSEEQKAKWIPPVIENDWQNYSAALIEPDFDFDPNDLNTVAVADGDDYVLDGEKTYVPFVHGAKAMIVYAALNGTTQGFIVPNGVDGMEVITDRQKLMSLNALPLYGIKLRGVRIPKSNLLAGDFALALASRRIANSSLAVGVARAAFEYSRDYAKEREAFGMKIAQKQSIAFMLAEMAVEIEASRLLTWEAAWKLDVGKPDASVAAYFAATSTADMAMMVTDRAVQILGGHGYVRDHPVEMWMRNGRGFTTFTGLAIV